jgi:hypothetical protein
VIGATVVAATCIAGSSLAASTTWAASANKVCTAWKAKAKAQLGNTAPKTPQQAYEMSVKATALERGELAALMQIPNPTPAGTRALTAVKTDIAEIAAGVAAWRSGDKAGFARIYNAWQKDFRPSKAFLDAGAKACG